MASKLSSIYPVAVVIVAVTQHLTQLLVIYPVSLFLPEPTLYLNLTADAHQRTVH